MNKKLLEYSFWIEAYQFYSFHDICSFHDGWHSQIHTQLNVNILFRTLKGCGILLFKKYCLTKAPCLFLFYQNGKNVVYSELDTVLPIATTFAIWENHFAFEPLNTLCIYIKKYIRTVNMCIVYTVQSTPYTVTWYLYAQS